MFRHEPPHGSCPALDEALDFPQVVVCADRNRLPGIPYGVLQFRDAPDGNVNTRRLFAVPGNYSAPSSTDLAKANAMSIGAAG